MAYIINPTHPEERAFWKQIDREKREQRERTKYVAWYNKPGGSRRYKMSDLDLTKLRRRLAKVEAYNFCIWSPFKGNRRTITEISQ